MNCSNCKVEIAAGSAVEGMCARCAAMRAVPMLPPGPTPGVTPPPAGAVPESTFFSPYIDPPDTTVQVGLPSVYAQGAQSYEDVKAEYEKEIGPIPIVRKKGK